MAFPNVSIQQVAKLGQRVPRSPSHRWHIRYEAHQIQPNMIAPVLPGETLKRASIKARLVSDPVKNPLIGWWSEHFLFYVKFRDLAGRDDFTEMLMDMDKSMSSYHSAASIPFYHQSEATPDRINYTKLCLQRIVEEFFRDDGETWDAQKIGEIPIAQIAQKSWMDSVVTEALFDAADEPTDDTGATAGEIERALHTWEFMRQIGMTDMTYDEYVGTYGVRGMVRDEPHRPELLRHDRDFAYPANTIDPTDGSPTSAMSWTKSVSVDKDRMFKEHGFVVGISVVRPKVYFKQQSGSAVSLLDNALTWMPAVMRDSPYTSMYHVDAGKGPVQVLTDGYWVDVRDLFIYGDQFTNIALTDTESNFVTLPTAANEKRYPFEADLDAMFVDAAGGNNLIREDGVCTMTILGTQTDQTPKLGG